MWSAPVDIWKEILTGPQMARMMSYTCKSAAAALRGLFTCEGKCETGYTVTGRYYENTIYFEEDSVRSAQAKWNNIARLGPCLVRKGNDSTTTHVDIDATHIMVDSDGLVFISTVDQLGRLSEVIGVPGIDITAIYYITGIHENFLPGSWADTTGSTVYMMAENWRVCHAEVPVGQIVGKIITLKPAAFYVKHIIAPLGLV